MWHDLETSFPLTEYEHDGRQGPPHGALGCCPAGTPAGHRVRCDTVWVLRVFVNPLRGLPGAFGFLSLLAVGDGGAVERRLTARLSGWMSRVDAPGGTRAPG